MTWLGQQSSNCHWPTGCIWRPLQIVTNSLWRLPCRVEREYCIARHDNASLSSHASLLARLQSTLDDGGATTPRDDTYCTIYDRPHPQCTTPATNHLHTYDPTRKRSVITSLWRRHRCCCSTRPIRDNGDSQLHNSKSVSRRLSTPTGCWISNAVVICTIIACNSCEIMIAQLF